MGILDNLKRIARPYDDETFEDYEEKPKAAPAASSWIEGEDLNVPEKKTGNKVVCPGDRRPSAGQADGSPESGEHQQGRLPPHP